MKKGIYWRGKRYRHIKRPSVKMLTCKGCVGGKWRGREKERETERER